MTILCRLSCDVGRQKMDWNAKRAQTCQGSSSLFLAESSSLQYELPGKRRARSIPLTLYCRDLLDLLTTSFENPWILEQLLWLNLAFDVAVLLCGALPRRDVKLQSYIQSSFLNSHEALRIRWRTWQVGFQEISTWRTSFKKRRHALQPSISSTYWTVKAISGGFRLYKFGEKSWHLQKKHHSKLWIRGWSICFCLRRKKSARKQNVNPGWKKSDQIPKMMGYGSTWDLFSNMCYAQDKCQTLQF